MSPALRSNRLLRVLPQDVIPCTTYSFQVSQPRVSFHQTKIPIQGPGRVPRCLGLQVKLRHWHITCLQVVSRGAVIYFDSVISIKNKSTRVFSQKQHRVLELLASKHRLRYRDLFIFAHNQKSDCYEIWYSGIIFNFIA